MAVGAEGSAAAEADSRIDEDWERIMITEEIAPLSHSAFRKLRKQVGKLGIAPLELP